ncbi:MAG TPA: ABC-2 family transporter protein, partial [Polyangiales bacterium]|nr:ABC-2 family transporter protein [Polyangiales bacterium]
MNGVLDDLRLFVRFVAVTVRSQLQYRAAFVMATLGQFLNTAMELCGIWALFARFGSLPGWSFAQVAFFYGFGNSAFALADALGKGFDTLGPTQIRTGDFDRLLLRPRSVELQLIARDFALRRVGRLITGGGALLYANAQLALDWDLARAALFAFAWCCAVSVFFAVIVLHGALSFWTVESIELMAVLSHGGVETMQYPMTIYERWLRNLFTYAVPIACVSYFPLLAVLDIPDPLGTPRWLQLLTPLAGPLFL